MEEDEFAVVPMRAQCDYPGCDFYSMTVIRMENYSLAAMNHALTWKGSSRLYNQAQQGKAPCTGCGKNTMGFATSPFRFECKRCGEQIILSL